MAFPVDFIDRLKSANPIGDVMGEYVTTKRSGQGYVCLCPFHNEKTPSCHINTDRGYFHCFGCNAGGDVITFVMKYHNLSYYEAVKLLCERANMDMPVDSYSKKAGAAVSKKKRLYEMNREAAKFFYHQLSTPEGANCVRYLTGVRGLRPETIKRYGIGCAPNSWTALKDHMLSLGFTESELLDGGLIFSSKNNTKRTFDFFVNRAMFPFIDLTGNIVGFGGRTLGDDKRKYINSRDSAVYNKNRFLFSLNIAKNAAVKSGRIILCEGNLDVISLVQAGFENAAASCGTALTPEQARLILDYAKEVVICYDADEAGQKAAQRAIGILTSVGLKASVVQINGAKDPDEFIKRYGAAAFEVLLEKSSGAVSYQLDKAMAKTDISSDVGYLEYKDEAVKIISGLSSPVERERHARRVAEQLNVSMAAIMAEVENADRRKERAAKKKQQQDAINFAHRRDPLNPQAAAHRGEAKAEEMIICFLYANPDYAGSLRETLPPERFVTELNRRVYEFLLDACENMTDRSIGAMNECFTPDEVGRVTAILERGRSEGITREVARQCVQRLLDYTPKKTGEMTDEEFLEFARKQREKKVKNRG